MQLLHVALTGPVRLMRLSQFLLENLETVLVRWEAFARSLPPGTRMSQKALRNDAERMLRFVAADIETSQSKRQQVTKAEGHGPALPDGEPSAAHDHGLQRVVDGFNLEQMVSEYRVLRACVTQLWFEAGGLDSGPALADSMQQLIRFNESIDQILAESVTRFNSQLERDKDLLLAMLGHDLRNPIASIQMCAQALLRSGEGPHGQELGTRILRSGKRMETMINDLLDFTRVRLGDHLPVTAQPCDMVEICRNVLDELQRAYPARQLTSRFDGRCVGTWDPGRIGQLVSNLVGNAVQHGSSDAAVTLATRCHPDEAVVTVHNFGTPIAPDRHDSIFDPLSRDEEDREGYGGSLGLGLYIAREIAEAHGGRIEVASSAADGTTFTVRLPKHGD